jgi:TorA maturation chaperone TorD
MTAPRVDAGAGPEAPEAAVARALARAGVYRLLATAFAAPTPETLADVAGTAAALGAEADLGPAGAAALRALGAAAAAAEPGAVAEEHGFLFDRQVRCPPYEGAYGPVDPMSAGKAPLLADLAGFYAAFGLAPAAAQPEVEDHLVAELEFMSALAVKEAWAELEGHADGRAVTRDAQAAFLRDHLGRWVDAFAAGLRAATPLPYYAAAADALATWVGTEVRALAVEPTPLVGLAPLGPAEADAFACPLAEPAPPGEGARPAPLTAD